MYNEKELFEIERKKLYNKIVSELTQDYKVLDTKYECYKEDNNLITNVTCMIEGPYTQKITADN